MIEGLKLQISSDELKKISAARAEYHAKKSDWFKSKAKEIQPELDNFADEAANLGKYSNQGNVVENLATKSKHHEDKATLFRFMAEHVIPNETYSLSNEDLVRLEVIGNRW